MLVVRALSDGAADALALRAVEDMQLDAAAVAVKQRTTAIQAAALRLNPSWGRVWGGDRHADYLW